MTEPEAMDVVAKSIIKFTTGVLIIFIGVLIYAIIEYAMQHNSHLLLYLALSAIFVIASFIIGHIVFYIVEP